MQLTRLAQQWVGEVIQAGDNVVDATLGNGFDALFLAQSIGESGHLFGFDIQPQALEATCQRLKSQPCHANLFLASHAMMSAYIPKHVHGKISAVMFNLGWLPHSDKRIITQASSTVTALGQSIKLLAPQGRISVIAYPGHPGGDVETRQVIHWLTQLCSQQAGLSLHTPIEQTHTGAPILLQITKHFV